MFLACMQENADVFAETNHPSGGLKVFVVDEFGDAICGASVYVCETKTCFLTGKNGSTPNIQIPIIPDNRFLEICKKDFAEITLVVFCEGFQTTCHTSAIVRANIVRIGPKIKLKKGDGYAFSQDPPDEKWVKRICEKFGGGLEKQ